LDFLVPASEAEMAARLTIKEADSRIAVLDHDIAQGLTRLDDSLAKRSLRNLEWIRKEASQHPIVERMLSDQTFVAPCLLSNDRDVRNWALIVIDLCWEADFDWPLLEPLVEEIAFNDQDPELRQRAMLNLGGILSQRDDQQQREVGKRIAELVLNPLESNDVRNSAYTALCGLSRTDGAGIDRYLNCLREPDFPITVDLTFVHSWLAEDQGRCIEGT